MAKQDDTKWKKVVAGDSKPPFYVFDGTIQKSEQDDRDYRLIRLENGLHAMLIHDATADKAAASLDVAVGHLYDPPDMPGLAHFCEHLLFMGTEQFPKENEYSEYLSKNNGNSNAYTSTSNTNYYFHVATPALAGALERFASFFHSPLFSPSCTSRELNAVDSEHKKNHQMDMWRIFQLNKHLSKPGHVWSKFGSGNRDSLTKAARDLKANGILVENKPSRPVSLQPTPTPSRIPSPAPSTSSAVSDTDADGGAVGRETRRRLVEWWSKEYCASRMRLCIIGKESLDELSSLASSLFSPIPNRGVDPLPMINDHPFGADEKGTLVSVQTVMGFHALEISFPLEYQPPNYRSKPAGFLAHFNLARGFAMFKVTIHLTEDGFKNYRNVILAAFHYLALLRPSQFDSFHQHERVLLSSLRFRFSEKKRPDDYATWVSEHMTWPIPPELLIAGPQLTWEWGNEGLEEKTIRSYLESFRVNGGRVVLMAKKEDHERVNPGTGWQTEPWYGTQYKVERWGQEFVEKADGPNPLPELYLPGPNEFVPSNLDVEKREVKEILKRPHLIRQTPLSTLWHKKDDRFWVPKANIMIDIRSPSVNKSARTSVLTRLYSDLVTDSLTEFSYDADLAGLSYSLFSHSTGLYITMSGYNDRMSVLVKDILGRIKNLTVDEQRLAALKEQAQREWRNFFLGQSYSLSDYYARYILTETQWTVEEKLKELPSVTGEDIRSYMKEFLSGVNLRMVVGGNIYKDEAIKIAEIAEEGLHPVESTKDLTDTAMSLPEGSDTIWAGPIVNPNQANSAITYYVHFGPVADQRLRVIGSLLVQVISEPAFNVLRTREQLGYVVSCTSWTLPGSSQKGMRIIVQSEKMPSYLEERVEAFIDEMKEKITTMTDAEFQEQKDGLKRKWLEAEKNLKDEVSRFIAHVNSGQWDFLRNENDAKLLDTVTKDEMQSLFVTRVHPSSPSRSKLSVHMISQKARPKRVSVEATTAFEAAVSQQFPLVDPKAWKADLEETPLLQDFTAYWKGKLGEDEKAQALLKTVPSLVEQYPLEGERQHFSKQGATYIQDIKQFKQSLQPSVDPGPLVEWNDLPVARF
ncbi:hypothetical protein EST38_g3526 [Candolleomyces aberdarensis]|uniref:Insulin-degrading enzyme n=1 Tax=Candolleomyces aberdarensis TaxID=2316362 RepID=A0A4Q2DRS8_9AGAR|nr:hypothetical protein EST38_g3526 [Candolleomyces aberdarensis]